MLPKTDGYGIMISAIQSREFGFGMEISEDHLEEVNIEHRREGNSYLDTEAAQEV